MENKYYNILTDIGKAQLTNAILQGDSLKLTTIKVGDGGADEGKEVFPNESNASLVRERWSGNINHLYVDEKNPLWVVVEAEIPAKQGGWCITEFGLYDEQDNLISIGKYPRTYKPKIEEGSGSSLYLKVILEVANAKNIELKVDPSIVLASRSYVDEKFSQKTDAIDEDDSNKLATAKAVHDLHLKSKHHFLNMPIFPEILQENNKLKITQTENTLTIEPDQVFIIRGWNQINTSDYSSSERTFSFQQNKTYHLRWNMDNGFTLYDLEDSNYNSKQLPETDEIFDTQYDDMLCVLVKDGQVTSLINRNILQYFYSGKLNSKDTSTTFDQYLNISGSLVFQLNWSRIPYTDLVSKVRNGATGWNNRLHPNTDVFYIKEDSLKYKPSHITSDLSYVKNRNLIKIPVLESRNGTGTYSIEAYRYELFVSV
ncbi:phage tail protein [Endozoicomonas sp. SM1973]|uniref:Phage tail protein n=1 Tax=Spartinivicinus marinus TaxID=2994442 RepID=A0A853I581_9GAMM|nr:phage tail protein [Spartinivicinus marinus]MCX4026913.1 phage tail protein [Spartinivicinus marinus]NYZ66742.1 phage tail protein [Spartinivicinus marinus]